MHQEIDAGTFQSCTLSTLFHLAIISDLSGYKCNRMNQEMVMEGLEPWLKIMFYELTSLDEKYYSGLELIADLFGRVTWLNSYSL